MSSVQYVKDGLGRTVLNQAYKPPTPSPTPTPPTPTKITPTPIPSTKKTYTPANNDPYNKPLNLDITKSVVANSPEPKWDNLTAKQIQTSGYQNLSQLKEGYRAGDVNPISLTKFTPSKGLSNVTHLNQGKTDTLTIVNVDPVTKKETIVRTGRIGGGGGLPSIAPPSPQAISEFYASQKPDTSQGVSINENILAKELARPGSTQTVQQGFMQPGSVQGANVQLAIQGLNKPVSQRTVQEQVAIIQSAGGSQAYQTAIQKQEELKQKYFQPQVVTQGVLKETSFLDNKYKPRTYPVDSKTSLPYVEPVVKKEKGYAPSTLEAYKPMVDISQEEYNRQIGLIESRIEKESGFYKMVFEPTGQNVQRMVGKFVSGEYAKAKKENDVFNSFEKDYISHLYDTFSSGVGFASAKANTFGLGIGQESFTESKSQGFILPYSSALTLAKQKEAERIQSNIDRFYTNKLVVESAGFVAGGSIATASTIGSLARAKSAEELVVPLAFGVAGRLATPLVGGALSKGISKFNEGVVKYSGKLLIGNKPVPQNVIVPNIFPSLTEASVGRAIILGGAGLEVAGIGLVPTEYKYEYIRNVGLYNAVIPIGYKVADTGIMLGKYSAIKGLDVGFKVADKLGLKYKGESVKGFDTYNRDVLMTTDIESTPTFVGSEKKMLGSLQDTSRAGIGEVYKRYGLDPKKLGTYSAIRSGSGSLQDYVEPGLVYYEGSKGSFFAPEINPIAMRSTGLKAKLFGERPSLYADYELGISKPNLEFATGTKATAISLKGNKLSPKAYEQLKAIQGYSEFGLQKSFSTDLSIEGMNIPKGTTFGELDYSKITGGKGNKVISRPLKSREIINLIGAEAWEKNFIDVGRSSVGKEGGFFSTQSRIIKATSESEVFTMAPRVRVEPITASQKLFRKLKFADAYVFSDFEAVPMNYELLVSKNLKALPSPNFKQLEGFKQIDVKPLQLESKKLLTSKSSSMGFVPERKFVLNQSNELVLASKVSSSGKGGYSQELESMFGSKYKPKVSTFAYAKLPVLIDTSKKQELTIDNSYKKSLTPMYKQTYFPKYSPVYVAEYTPVYEPKYVPEYTPVYSPKYTSTYEPTYSPPYQPEYTPSYVPPYQPEYSPKYTPPYIPKYTPKYVPKYVPKYEPPYKPKPEIYSNKYQLPTTKYEKRKGKGYLTFIRKKGKVVQISKEPLSYGLALQTGKSATRSGLSQSFFIKTFGYTKYSDTMAPSLQEYRLKKPTSKIREQVFIEKNPLATRGETKLLQQAKKSKRSLFG